MELCPDGVVRDGKSRGEFAPFKERQYRGDVSSRRSRITGGEQTLIGDFDFYVGTDLAVEKHQACVVNRTGRVVGELAFEHSGTGLIDFIPLVGEAQRFAGDPSWDCSGNAKRSRRRVCSGTWILSLFD